MKSFIFLLLLASTTSLFAASDKPAPPQEHPEGKNPAVEKALQACAKTVGTDSSGHPDMAKMDECMSAKGFQKPPHPPKGN